MSETRPRQVEIYLDSNGESPFEHWFDQLRDQTGKNSITRRLKRLKLGNFGDCKRFGVITELRIAVGPGYRVYLGQDGLQIVILLMGGDKSNQSKDILRARGYWSDYESRKKR